MYATLSYDVSAGPTPVEDVRRLILEPFGDRPSGDLPADTFTCEIKSFRAASP